MNREMAIEQLKTHPLYVQEWDSDYYMNMSKAFKTAVKSLEAWTNLKEELSNLPIGQSVSDCLYIINKYLKEIENDNK